MHSKLFAGLLALILIAVIGTARPAQAQLTLTPAGTALGFSLSTFASGFPSESTIGPLGITFLSAGGILVSDYPGNVRLFPTDTDGQNAASVPVAQNYGGHNAIGLAQVGGNIYMVQKANKDVVQLNPNGTLNQTIIGVGPGNGIVGNATDGHLFVSNTNNEIFDVNPLAKTETVLETGTYVDGLTLSFDERVLYGADGVTGHIYGFDTSTGAKVFDSGFVPGGVDGTALGTGNLAGNIFANTNSGTLVEINLATDAQTLIASGGSRGDFVMVDPSNGTLLLTQTDRIIRLSGGSFAPVPEASSFVSLGLLLGLGGLTISVRRKRRSVP